MLPSFQARGLGIQGEPFELLTWAAGAGFPAVELLVRDLMERGVCRAAYRLRMGELGLVAGGMAFPFGWRGDAASFAAGIQRLPIWADCAAALGVRCTSTWVLPEVPRICQEPGGPPTDRRGLVSWHQDRLGRIAEILASVGIALGLETIGVVSFRTPGSEVFLDRVSHLEPVLGPLERIGRNLGFTLDAWHCRAAGEAVRQAVHAAGGRVVCVHVADPPVDWSGDATALDDSNRDFPRPEEASASRALLRALADTGYLGPVMVEPMGGCHALQNLPPERRAQRASVALQGIWPAGIAWPRTGVCPGSVT